jgi:hypothetical protein
MEETKVCRKCGTEKQLTLFTTRLGKYTSRCKSCTCDSHKEWRKNNLEKARASEKVWAAKNKQKRAEKNRKWYENLSIEKRLYRLLCNASNGGGRNIEFKLSLDDLLHLWEKQQGRCAYTNLPLTSKGYQINTVSLDRLDSNGIYEPSNVQLVCVAVNRMKLDHDEKVFIQLCRIVARNNEGEEYPIDLADTV